VSETLDARIRAELERPIRSGEWPPGHRIPVEHELVARFGCSRATVSKAISALVAAGLIERRKRAGSFVAPPRLHGAMLEIPDIALVLRVRGLAYRFELDRRRVTGQRLILEGVHIGGDRPFAHEAREISLEQVPAAEAADFSAQAPGSWLLRHVPWTEARHRVSAVIAPRPVARRLDLPASAPCLKIERSTWAEGSLVTSVVQIFPGDRYDLTGSFGPSPYAQPAVSA
jgi:GntR family transcriptional regulator, histidine utilization repressor